MARRHPKNCKVCGRTVDEVGSISATGLCPDDSLAREIENLLGLKAKSGPMFEHWARRSLMAMRRALVASEQEAP